MEDRKPMQREERKDGSEPSLITTSARPERGPLRHPWRRCITVGRGYELLRADLQEHLRFLRREFGYRHIRFHASFHDDVAVVHKLPDGSIAYRWTQLDHIYDFLVEAGFDPIVEINPMPKALASGEETFFWYEKNITPPASWTEWERFLQAYIEHTVERYGRERVRRWYFEVWNEPDLRNQFWSGTKEEYFQLYTSCARVLKGFDPELRVGGPATAGSAWTLDLARHCRDHAVPLDFISYHGYPQNESHAFASAEESPDAPGMYFIRYVRETQKALVEEGFGELPIFMTEWNAQAHGPDWKAKWVGNRYINRLFAGAAVCHLAHACDGHLNMMGWWVASDVFEEGGPQVEPYGTRFQYYGMLTIDGVPKSSYHAFRFLGRMNGPRYELALPEATPPTRHAIVTDEGVATRCLIWNTVFPHDEPSDWNVRLRLPVPPTQLDREEVRLTLAHVKEGQGSAFEFWEAMGRPPNLTRTEQEALRARSEPAFASAMMGVKDGCLELGLRLKPNEFVFLEVGGDPPAVPVAATPEQRQLDEALRVEENME